MIDLELAIPFTSPKFRNPTSLLFNMKRNLLIALFVCVGATMLVRSAAAKPAYVSKPPVIVPPTTPVVPGGTIVLVGDAPPYSDR